MSTKRGGQGGTIVNVSSAAARLGAPGDYVDYAEAEVLGQPNRGVHGPLRASEPVVDLVDRL